jgi:gas vesicle protein
MKRRKGMSENDWYEDDEPYYPEPYVVVERRETGIGTFLIGLALGAGAALLFAPQSGEETRRGIARRARRAQEAAQDLVEDVSGTVADKFNEVRETVGERIDATLEAVDDKKRRVSNAFHAGRTAAREARGELEQRIAESKAAYKDI